MNLKAAEIAWNIAMEHNETYRALTPVVRCADDYDAAKRRFFRGMYKMIVSILEAPDITYPDNGDFLAGMLVEETKPGP